MALDTTPIRGALIDHALTLGWFGDVSGHEPKNKPPNGLSAAIWVQTVRPAVGASGLSATSAVVTFRLRIYQNMLMEPQDDIDPMVDGARDAFMSSLIGDFTLGGLIRNVDVRGQLGETLSAQAGYLSIDGTMHRVMDVTVPCIVNDCWPEAV